MQEISWSFTLHVLIILSYTGGSSRLVSGGTADLPGALHPCHFAGGSTFSLHMWREPFQPTVFGTTTPTNTPGSSATDASEFTPSSVCPSPAHDLSADPAPADAAAPDANSYTASFASTDTAHHPAAPVPTSKSAPAAFPNFGITSVPGCASAVR